VNRQFGGTSFKVGTVWIDIYKSLIMHEQPHLYLFFTNMDGWGTIEKERMVPIQVLINALLTICSCL